MDGDPLKQRFEAWQAITEARSAIALAKQRAETVDELCTKLTTTTSPDELGRVVYALLERVSEGNYGQRIAETLRQVSVEAENRPSAERSRLDRSTGRLMSALDPALTLPLALEWGRHHTKRRRQWAIKTLRNAPLNNELRSYLLERFEATSDVEFLKLIIREPLPPSLDRSKLYIAFEGISGGYWQARVAEAALKADPNLAATICAEMPHAFIWAAGRLGRKEFAALIVAALERANDKLPLIGIAVWALGKLGAKSELLSLEPMISELEREYPDPFA